MKTVAILATLDTKAAEADFMRSEIESLGGKALLMDLSLVGDSELNADISKQELIEAGGGNFEELLVKYNLEQSSPFVVAGATKLLLALQKAGKIDAVVMLGGTGGTSTYTPILKALPYGFPKIKFSSLGSGDTSPFASIKDIATIVRNKDKPSSRESCRKRKLTSIFSAQTGNDLCKPSQPNTKRLDRWDVKQKLSFASLGGLFIAIAKSDPQLDLVLNLWQIQVALGILLALLLPYASRATKQGLEVWREPK